MKNSSIVYLWLLFLELHQKSNFSKTGYVKISVFPNAFEKYWTILISANASTRY